MNTGNNRAENEPGESNQYLWDGSGPVDAEVQKLETLLSSYRHDRPAAPFDELVPARRRRFLPQRFWLIPAAALAMAVLILGAVIFMRYGRKSAGVTVAGWDVSRVAGNLRIGSKWIGGQGDPGQLAVGQMLETDSQSSAQLRAWEVGQIEVDPSTRLRLLSMGKNSQRIALDRGTIHAYIWAPAGQFVVDTPSAMTVDLGCAYTLHVDDSGAGTVRTSRGWVGFKLNGRESFIPAGAACATRPKIGPGTPYFEDAAEKFRSALTRFDFEDTVAEQRAQDLAIVLNESRKQDALTLWHLLARVDEAQRSVVYDRLQHLAPAPAGVTRDGILHLDQSMLDLWWNQLGFDDIAVWRHWERSWAGASAPSK